METSKTLGRIGEKETVRILSPVNSFEGAVKVIDAGADEVYCGVRYPGLKYHGLSTRTAKCSLDSYGELGKVVRYAHDKGVKVLVTLEFPYMSELLEKTVEKHAKLCTEKNIDALILGDIGLILKVKQMRLGVPFHASTYLSSMNYEAVDFLRKLGAERVILERQVSIDEITQIVKSSDGVEIEVFVHGTGCSNINVSCYGCYTPESLIRSIPNKLSTGDFELYQNYGFTTPLKKFKMITAPFCRLTYEVTDENAERKKYAPILDAYSFCSLCKLPALVKTGVAGFKIVDRCQSKEYQETCTRTYRELVNLVEQEQIELFNRRLISIIRDNRALLFPNFSEVCEQERCYYSPLFHTPYRMPIS